MKNQIYSVIIVLLLSTSAALALETPYESFFSKKQKIDNDGTELYTSNYELKKYKKFGVGMALGGTTGALGISGEFNLDPANTLVIGMGTGPSYGNFNILGKYNFESMYLTPFIKAGYSRWFGTGGATATATSSDVLRQIYSEKTLRTGKFDTNFLVASIGAEYNQLEGELSGLNFYGEFTLLGEPTAATLIPTGAVGVIYFY